MRECRTRELGGGNGERRVRNVRLDRSPAAGAARAALRGSAAAPAGGGRGGGMTSTRLTYRGEHYRYDDVPMELAPLQRPYPPFWYATSNVESVPWAASRNMNLVGLGPAAAYRPFVEKYRAVWPEHRDDPRRLNPHVETPRIGINRQVVVADTDREAEAIARAAHPRWAASFVKLWADPGDPTYAQRVNR